jgi:Ni,Fe-hydrogenase III small subunit
MFVLLSQLNRLRRRIGLRAPERRGSLAIRLVDAGSCNGCEHELGAVSGPHYDLACFGISIAASPRHADVLLVTGCVTTRMAKPLQIAYDAMPEPRLVAAMGDCALGRGVLGDPAELLGAVDQVLPVDLCIPGCPPTPAVIVSSLCAALGRRRGEVDTGMSTRDT